MRLRWKKYIDCLHTLIECVLQKFVVGKVMFSCKFQWYFVRSPHLSSRKAKWVHVRESFHWTLQLAAALTARAHAPQWQWGDILILSYLSFAKSDDYFVNAQLYRPVVSELWQFHYASNSPMNKGAWVTWKRSVITIRHLVLFST